FFPCDRWPHYSTTKLAFSPTGERLGYVHSDSFACVWDLGTGKEVRRFDVQQAGFVSCGFSRGGKEVGLSAKKRGCLWELDTGKELLPFAATNANLSPDARTFTKRAPKTVIVGDTLTGKDRLTLTIDAVKDGIENGIAFSSDGNKIALVERHKTVQVRDT